jgi:general nucleoside transport system ATP-binding protein
MEIESNQTSQDPQIPILRMKGITKRFPGVTANDNVNLDLKAGEVLALLGENGAGKSSLMNVLVGLYRPDEGTIEVRGQQTAIHSPADADVLGIGMIHQEFMLVETMSVAENIILGMKALPSVPDLSKISKRIVEISDRYNLKVDPNANIWQLSVGERQRVEILKLIYRGAEILILDEPTAVLTPQESKELNRVIQQMTGEGKSAIFITHKMDEVMNFSDKVCVLQQGKLIATKATSETNPRELACLMVGKEVLFQLDKKPFNPGKEVLSVKNLSALDTKGHLALKQVSFNVHQNEVFGIAGVAGNGQKELVEAITGLHKTTEGTIKVDQIDHTNKSPICFIKSGISHIPADRLKFGVSGTMQVAENLIMKNYRMYPTTRKGLLNVGAIKNFATKMIDRFNISTPSQETHVKFLSGGNIQKTILAREIDSCRNLLIAAYPSRGLDVGATEAVRTRILEQRDQDKAVLLVSEELEELLTVADRIAVMFEGKIMGIVDANNTTIEALGLMMAGVEEGA